MPKTYTKGSRTTRRAGTKNRAAMRAARVAWKATFRARSKRQAGA